MVEEVTCFAMLHCYLSAFYGEDVRNGRPTASVYFPSRTSFPHIFPFTPVSGVRTSSGLVSFQVDCVFIHYTYHMANYFNIQSYYDALLVYLLRVNKRLVNHLLKC